MERNDPLSVIFQHNLWANLRLFEQCAELTDEQLDADLLGGYGSIRATLEHLVNSEQSYFSRISTGQPFSRAEDAPPMTLPAMIAALRQTGEGLIEWTSKVSAEDHVEVLWDGEPRQVPKSIILAQVINHATDHRSQIKTIMTQWGIEPPDLQSWAYFDEMDQ